MLKLILTIVLTLVLFAGSIAMLLLIPFKKKTAQKIIVAFSVVFAIVMFFIPASVICSIPIPFLNNTGYDLVEKFLNTSEQLRDLNELAPGFKTVLISMIANVIKSSVVFVVEGLVFLFSSTILWISYLASKKEKNKKKFRASLATFGCFVLSIVFMLVPVYSVANVYGNLKNAITTETRPFYEAFPEYSEYTPIFKLLDAIEPYANGDIVVSDVPLWVSDSYSFGDTSLLSSELSKVDTILHHFNKSGLTIIFDDSFDFTQTKKGTFDFYELEQLLKMCEESEVFEPVARSFVNHVMDSLELTLTNNNPIEGKELNFTKEELKNQYMHLMDMLDFVVDYDLVNLVGLNITKSNIEDMLKNALKFLTNLDRLANMLHYPFVDKAKIYLGDNTSIETIIYLCVKLYDAMNDWLEYFRTTSLYNTAYRFLDTKGVI